MSNVRRARLSAAGCVVVAGVLLASCGGNSGTSAGASTTPTTSAPAAASGGGSGGGGFGSALSVFRECMSSHGVTVPSGPGNGNRTPPSTTPGETFPPRSGGGGFGSGNFAGRFDTPPPGVDAATYSTALDACRSKLPTGTGAANDSAFQAYRSCMQDHGVTLPAAGAAGSENRINRDDPKVQAALNACAPLRPAGPGRRGGSGSTTTTTVPA